MWPINKCLLIVVKVSMCRPPGIPLTPRLSNALFGDAPLEDREQDVATHEADPASVEASPEVAAIPLRGEWTQPSDGYDEDDDFFDYVSGFPEDEARTVQYSKLLAESGNRDMPEMEVSSDNTVSESATKQEAAKAAFQAVMESFRAAAARQPRSRSHVVSHAHQTEDNIHSPTSEPSDPPSPEAGDLLYTYVVGKDARVNSSVSGTTCKACQGEGSGT